MTGGLDGYLRQEFRELEILDEITKLRYNNKLSSNVYGETRSHIISSYRRQKGANYIPSNMPNALQWNSKNPYILADPFDEAQWEIIKYENKENSTDSKSIPKKNISSKITPKYIVAEGTNVLHNLSSISKHQISLKRKHNTEVETSNKRTAYTSTNQQLNSPIGFKWDELTYSCAYDSLFTILLNILHTTPHDW
ncbi:hypothetical protein BDY19DRAFT_899810, partial [Irpex rosettiformis]